MRTIWKFLVEAQSAFHLDMPKDAEILTVHEQGDTAHLWALVDSAAPLERRFFRVFGTGHEVDAEPDHLSHVGTFFLYDGGLVFHVFEALL